MHSKVLSYCCICEVTLFSKTDVICGLCFWICSYFEYCLYSAEDIYWLPTVSGIDLSEQSIKMPACLKLISGWRRQDTHNKAKFLKEIKKSGQRFCVLKWPWVSPACFSMRLLLCRGWGAPCWPLSPAACPLGFHHCPASLLRSAGSHAAFWSSRPLFQSWLCFSPASHLWPFISVILKRVHRKPLFKCIPCLSSIFSFCVSSLFIFLTRIVSLLVSFLKKKIPFFLYLQLNCESFNVTDLFSIPSWAFLLRKKG